MRTDADTAARPHEDDDYTHAAHLMQQIGGGFAGHIARAYFAADRHNRARLRAAFPDLFTKYFNLHLNRDFYPIAGVDTKE